MITTTSGAAARKYSTDSSARTFCGWYTGIPAAVAASFTGELATSLPRPRGRFGCVTTPTIWKSGWAINSCREGRANAGVPQKIIFSGGTGVLPLAGFFQLADFALDEVAFQHAEVGDEENAVEVINFVAERASEEAFAAAFKGSARRILRADGDVLRALHVAAKSREREAAFLFALLAFGINNFGIGEDHFCLGNFSVGDVNNREAQADANLRRGEPYTRGGVHGFEHVRDELLQVVVEFFHPLAGGFEDGVAVFHNRMNHRQLVPMRSARFQARRDSSVITGPLSLITRH